ELIERTHNALETMQGLERHRGHFFNWYDTRSLKPLPPLYISSVDSGNLACHLLTLRPGLLALADASILAPRCFEGLRDTAALIGSTGPEVDSLRSDIESTLASPPATAKAAVLVLERLAGRAAQIEAQPWAQALARQCTAAVEELTLLPSEQFMSLRELASLNDETGRRARERIGTLQRLARQSGELARMEYGLLVDKARKLFAIGYNVAEHRLDPSCYDLLASEARAASFVAIAQGQLPQESWFALGRLLTSTAGAPVVERLDVRVPDAAPGDADVRKHAARAHLPGRGPPADRLRPRVRRALGHVRIRLQHGRRRPQLSVPRLRRARPRAEAGTAGGRSGCALRLGARADGGARG